MDPVQKVLWFVENHSREPITLEAIARACKVSSFHLTCRFRRVHGAFSHALRSGSEAERGGASASGGRQDILEVALDAGYGSHEAFTHAFRDQFSLTPEQLRSQGHTNNIPIVEAILMDATIVPEIAPPRFETLESTRFAGLVERYDCQSPSGIPDQWQRFARISDISKGRWVWWPTAYASTSTAKGISITWLESRSRATLVCPRGSVRSWRPNKGTQCSRTKDTSPAFEGRFTQSGASGFPNPAISRPKARPSNGTVRSSIPKQVLADLRYGCRFSREAKIDFLCQVCFGCIEARGL